MMAIRSAIAISGAMVLLLAPAHLSVATTSAAQSRRFTIVNRMRMPMPAPHRSRTMRVKVRVPERVRRFDARLYVAHDSTSYGRAIPPSTWSTITDAGHHVRARIRFFSRYDRRAHAFRHAVQVQNVAISASLAKRASVAIAVVVHYAT
jgi:hypothetical protein